ncbi:PIG-L deacetylase family protein [Streptomyces sp. NPDC058657]|uniref:PIG-L deacetylase family protein n=1 Tax=unclassified Streptomyces TaxID=2593676 RepID=UPI00364C8CEB
MVFSPHPDDEVIAVGGTMARLAAEGARVGVAFATDGAMSHSAVLGIHQNPTPAELRRVRREEARSAVALARLVRGRTEKAGAPRARPPPGCAGAAGFQRISRSAQGSRWSAFRTVPRSGR